MGSLKGFSEDYDFRMDADIESFNDTNDANDDTIERGFLDGESLSATPSGMNFGFSTEWEY